MAQDLAREFSCLSCHRPIKISKIDNPAPGQKKNWERFELDGVTTPHKCTVKKKEEDIAAASTGVTTVLDGSPPIVTLAEEVRSLRGTVDILISQIQGEVGQEK